jgi:ceramide glucosyltransferase
MLMLLLTAIAAAAAAYQLIAMAACFRHRLVSSRQPASTTNPPPVSVLKPVRGLDDGFYQAIRSQAVQQYPAEFEILFGIASGSDPARPIIEKLIREFPQIAIRVIVCPTQAQNGKVGVLIDLVREARHSIFVVNDSDITVEPDYLRTVIAPLTDPSIGLVTCLYRATAANLPSRFEALGVATDFAPSTLVAPLFGVSEFGLGSTLAFRRSDLDRIGGFRAIAEYIADDYQLGAKLHRLGLKNLISPVVVTTRLSAPSWSTAWRHQLRWARTIRLSRGGGYAGLPITFATLWAAVAAAAGMFSVAAALFALRFSMAIIAGWFVLGSPDVLRYFYLIPLRDLWGVAVWFRGLFGDTVEWRDRRLRLDRQGRIL